MAAKISIVLGAALIAVAIFGLSSHEEQQLAPITKGPDYNEISKPDEKDSPNTRETDDSRSQSEPQNMVEAVVSGSTLNEFPKLYEHKYVEFVGWNNALVESAASVKAQSSQQLFLPDDCNFVLHFLPADGANAVGCVDHVPANLLSPFGASEENIEVYCEVERVSAIGIFLTHCELTPSEHMKMKENEHQLEQAAH